MPDAFPDLARSSVARTIGPVTYPDLSVGCLAGAVPGQIAICVWRSDGCHGPWPSTTRERPAANPSSIRRTSRRIPGT
jgi:hypothetical protein